jgi:long-chain acyl-CoA synthetase
VEISRFFYAAGLTILEGYGLTESSPVLSVNCPGAMRIGSVGRPLPGVSIRIAEDGEILARGANVMTGYYGDPDATREALDAGGWLHTGDIGMVDDGFVYITDRKKDLIVTAGGKNIAPQPIENRVRVNRFVSQAVLLGDKHKFPILLVVPNFAALEDWAKAEGISFTDRVQLVGRAEVQAKMEQEVFGSLPDLARYETPKKIGLLAQELTVEAGELTPSLKIKRRIVEEHYASVIASLYSQAGYAAAHES